MRARLLWLLFGLAGCAKSGASTTTASSSASTSASSSSVPIAADGADVGAADAGTADAALAMPQIPGLTVAGLDSTDFDIKLLADQAHLVSLVAMTTRDDKSLAIAREILGGKGPQHSVQGNPDIVQHPITRKMCLDGLKDVVLQTAEQKEVCGGDYEVPIHKGDPSSATTCIDAFEYPNKPCELPFVYSYLIVAEKLCALNGKRLCSDEEWNQGCENDPKGGPPSKYAYGEELDMKICHTGQPWPPKNGPVCQINDDLWGSCATNTAPAGAYPKCRSRLGVFDQHGNVAEAMTRRDKEDKKTYSQLKGSAFFYDGVMYKDHCRFDPRWHVENAWDSWHVNYHLGFRCCRDVTPLKDRKK